MVLRNNKEEIPMKKAFLCLICAVLLLVSTVPALAEAAAPEETPVYTLTNMVYGNSKILGTAVHDDATAIAPRLYARVTVFFVGGSYIIFSDYVEDGVIDIEVHGTVLAITVELTNTKYSAPGQPSLVYDTWGQYYKN